MSGGHLNLDLKIALLKIESYLSYHLPSRLYSSFIQL
jgi:hypothetical protein